MNWDDFRIFLTVARCGTLTGAGRSLGVSHTTVSRRLGSFEEQLGERLFDRLPGGFVLTELGRELLDTAQQMEARVDQAQRSILAQDDELAGPLRVSAPHLLLEEWLFPYLLEFSQLHPQIELQLVSSGALLSLARRELDVAIRATDTPPETAIGRRLLTLHSAVYGHREYLAGRPHAEDPTRLSWIGLEPEEDDADNAFVQKHLPGIPVQMRLNSSAQIFRVLKAGLGIGRLPTLLGERDPQLARLPGLPIERALDLWILIHRDLKNTARVRSFLDFIRQPIERDAQEVQQLLQSSTAP